MDRNIIKGNFGIKTRPKDSKSKLHKRFEIDQLSENKYLTWSTVKAGYKALLAENYNKSNIIIKVMTPIGLRTLKGFDDDLDNTLEDYFVNKVKDKKKFTKQYEKIVFDIFE